MFEGMVFDIKRFAIHDGPGIRTTVFFKGCPMHCLWCHNPEGINQGFELMFRSSRCAKCYSCLNVCQLGALSKSRSSSIVVDRAKCNLCGECVKVCMSGALEIAGREVAVQEIIAEVEKDQIFYEQSGGGVTLSGGEPLFQSGFCESVLDELNRRKIHAALDTSGLIPWKSLWRSARKADLILYDLKMIDSDRHKKYTGVSNTLVLDNLKRLAAAKKEIAVRVPLMAGVNDDEQNIRRTINFLRLLKSIKNIGLLRYHKGGEEKTKNLGKASRFRIFEPPSERRLDEISRAFAQAGFAVKIGG